MRDFPDTRPTIVSANISKVANSGGPNFNAIIASGAATSVEKVLDAIKTTPKTAKEIAKELGLPEPKVRGVLYANPVTKRITKAKIEKKMHYVAKEAAASLKAMKSQT